MKKYIKLGKFKFVQVATILILVSCNSTNLNRNIVSPDNLNSAFNYYFSKRGIVDQKKEFIDAWKKEECDPKYLHIFFESYKAFELLGLDACYNSDFNVLKRIYNGLKDKENELKPENEQELIENIVDEIYDEPIANNILVEYKEIKNACEAVFVEEIKFDTDGYRAFAKQLENYYFYEQFDLSDVISDIKEGKEFLEEISVEDTIDTKSFLESLLLHLKNEQSNDDEKTTNNNEEIVHTKLTPSFDNSANFVNSTSTHTFQFGQKWSKNTLELICSKQENLKKIIDNNKIIIDNRIELDKANVKIIKYENSNKNNTELKKEPGYIELIEQKKKISETIKEEKGKIKKIEQKKGNYSFENLKDEVLRNTYAPITGKEWNSTLKKCDKILKGKQTNSRNWLQENEVKLNHLIPLKLFTDFKKLRNEFTRCFSEPDNTERCEQFFHLSKAFENTFEKFKFCEKFKFWQQPEILFHGESSIMNIDQTEGTFYGPLSTTTDIHVARSVAGKKGMIMVLKPSEKSKFKVLDISWISDYPDEHEYLIFDHTDLQITNIIAASDYDEYYHYCQQIFVNELKPNNNISQNQDYTNIVSVYFPLFRKHILTNVDNSVFNLTGENQEFIKILYNISLKDQIDESTQIILNSINRLIRLKKIKEIQISKKFVETEKIEKQIKSMKQINDDELFYGEFEKNIRKIFNVEKISFV